MLEALFQQKPLSIGTNKLLLFQVSEINSLTHCGNAYLLRHLTS